MLTRDRSVSTRSAEVNIATPSDTEISGNAVQGSTEPDAVMVPLPEGLPVERRRAKLPCHLMGPFEQLKGFYGRDDVLSKLDGVLLPEQELFTSSEPRALRYAAVHGLAGMGKTAVAVQYMLTRRSHFRAIFWVRADSVPKLETDIASIAGHLGLEDPADCPNEVVRRELAKGWLSKPTEILDKNLDATAQAEVPWLLIFDNADDPLILNDYIPLFPSGSVLVTSQYPLMQAVNEDWNTSPKLSIQLAPFSVDEAAHLLRNLTGPNRGPESSSLLVAQRLGGHALAIAQMAGKLRKDIMSYDDFLQRYDRVDRYKIMPDLPPDPDSFMLTARGTIFTSFAIEKLNSHALLILESLSLLDPDEIPQSVLSGLYEFNIDGERDENQLDRFDEAQADLLGRSLVSRSSDTKTVSVHRVLQDTIRVRMSVARLKEVGGIVVSLLRNAWGAVPLDKKHKIDRWGTCEGLWPHVLCIDSLAGKGMVPMDGPSEIELAYLLKEAGW